MNTRRDFLRASFSGLMIPAFAAFGDDKKIGTIYASIVSMRVGNEDVRGILAIDPEHGSWKNILPDPSAASRISPDGKTITFRRPKDSRLWLADVADEREPRPLIDVSGAPFWSADGKTLIVSSYETGTWRVNADGGDRVGKLTEQKVPIRNQVLEQ